MENKTILSATNGRIQILDALKGVAIILMIVNHVQLDGSVLWRFIGVFHMPLFFILSGYLYKDRSMSDMLYRNVRKVLLPYICTCLLLWLIICIAKRDFTWGFSIIYGNSRPFPSYGMFKVGPLWFLTAFFCSMIYINLLQKIKFRLYKWIVVSVVFAMSVFVVRETGYLLPFGMTTGVGGAIFILVGMELKEHPELIINKKYLYPGLIIWLICVCGGKCIMSYHIYKLNLIQVIGGLYGTYVCYKILGQLRQNSLSYRALCYVGANSLSMLCIHSIDRVLQITYRMSNYILGYTSTDVLHWQLEIALKILFVIILFSIYRQIPILRKVYSIEKG